jgi:hypothetical protein
VKLIIYYISFNLSDNLLYACECYTTSGPHFTTSLLGKFHQNLKGRKVPISHRKPSYPAHKAGALSITQNYYLVTASTSHSFQEPVSFLKNSTTRNQRQTILLTSLVHGQNAHLETLHKLRKLRLRLVYYKTYQQNHLTHRRQAHLRITKNHENISPQLSNTRYDVCGWTRLTTRRDTSRQTLPKNNLHRSFSSVSFESRSKPEERTILIP